MGNRGERGRNLGRTGEIWNPGLEGKKESSPGKIRGWGEYQNIRNQKKSPKIEEKKFHKSLFSDNSLPCAIVLFPPPAEVVSFPFPSPYRQNSRGSLRREEKRQKKTIDVPRASLNESFPPIWTRETFADPIRDISRRNAWMELLVCLFAGGGGAECGCGCG
jgi:hypothetical protein